MIKGATGTGPYVAAETAGPPHDWKKYPSWERTPRHMFWRPAWRIRSESYNGITKEWRYQTNNQRARQILAERCDPRYQTHMDTEPTMQAAPHLPLRRGITK